MLWSDAYVMRLAASQVVCSDFLSEALSTSASPSVTGKMIAWPGGQVNAYESDKTVAFCGWLWQHGGHGGRVEAVRGLCGLKWCEVHTLPRFDGFDKGKIHDTRE